MSILYLHGFCATLNGRKAGFLRASFGEETVVEPPSPGFPYCRCSMSPVLQIVGERFKRNPRSLLPLLGPNRVNKLKQLAPEFVQFFARSVEMAQELYRQVRPDLIVGSSLGGGVAMAMNTLDTPMVLISPVWNSRVKPGMASQKMPDAGKMTKALLSITTAAMRVPIARYAGFEVPPVVKPRTLILHSGHDEVFDLSNSRTLVRRNPIPAVDPSRPSMDRVINRLTAAGYANQRSADRVRFNDGRLIVIGKDHKINEAHPADRSNKDPHPLNALVMAVRFMREEFA